MDLTALVKTIHREPFGELSPPRLPIRRWDVILTSALLGLDVVIAIGVGLLGLFLVLGSEMCGATLCDVALLKTGAFLGRGLPVCLLAAATITSALLLHFRRIAFWVPLVAAVLMPASLVVGYQLVVASVG